MRYHQRFSLSVMLVFFIHAEAFAELPERSNAFAEIVKLSGERLEIAKKVADVKWDNGTPVEDKGREAVVLSMAAEKASVAGIPRNFALRFFSDQIEANKMVQSTLIGTWRHEHRPVSTSHVDLNADIRPTLDRLQTEMIAQLLANATARRDPSCSRLLADAIEAQARRKTMTGPQRDALNRSVAALCEDE